MNGVWLCCVPISSKDTVKVLALYGHSFVYLSSTPNPLQVVCFIDQLLIVYLTTTTTPMTYHCSRGSQLTNLQHSDIAWLTVSLPTRLCKHVCNHRTYIARRIQGFDLATLTRHNHGTWTVIYSTQNTYVHSTREQAHKYIPTNQYNFLPFLRFILHHDIINLASLRRTTGGE